MVETSAGFRSAPVQRYLARAGTELGVPLWAQLSVQLTGAVDRDRLAAAVTRTRARHEALRTNVRTIAGAAGPIQVIQDRASGLDAGYDPSERPDLDAELDRIRAAERDLLDVAAGSASRAALIRLGRHGWQLILTAHALVADRRSLRRWLAEIAAGYAAGGTTAQQPIQYPDYAAWHHELLTDPDRAGRREYWDGLVRAARQPGHVAGGPAPGGGRPAGAGWRTRRVTLDAALADRLAGLAQRHRLAPDLAFATAWSALLWRLNGERDTVILAGVRGRSYPELEHSVGPFARALPVVGHFDPGDSFLDAARQVQAALTAATEQADDLDPNRIDPAPGGPAGFEYLDDPDPIEAGELRWTAVHEADRAGPQPLLLRGGQGAGGGWVELCHDSGAVPDGRAGELLERFLTLLGELAATPDAALGAAGLLLDGERERLLAASAGPARPVPPHCLHELFRTQAARTPQATAVVCGDRELGYAELDRAANRLARYLIEHGVRPGSRVVLQLERSPELLVGLLAVLKAGAAYVPLDAATPWRRTEFVLTDVAAPLLLTDAAGADRWPDLPVPVVCLDPDRPVAAGYPDLDPDLPADPDDLAYVMYTSGSTGLPNGVAVPHRALVNYLTWAAEAYRLAEGSGALVHTSAGFDLTVTGLLGPLLAGQRVILVPDRAELAGLVAELRARDELTVLKLTPTHLQVLGQLMPPAELTGRTRTIVVGGEDLTAEVLAPFLAAGTSGTRIVNEYGPTETVVGSCAFQLDAVPQAGPVPVGRPIANTRLYVLDQRLAPVPVGVPGEIYIGGSGVGDGYLGRPDLSAQRFVADPFDPDPAARLYKTGDRGCWLPGGNLQYLGRLDEQVKVRGFRVELGEIEHVLTGHPRIAQAGAVAVRDTDRPGPLAVDTRLVAYVVVVAGASPDPAELVSYCRDRLPEHAVPHAIVPVPALPVTANGKLDRAALRRIRPGRPGAGDYAPPRTDTEEILAGAIASVLGLDRVGVDDNYFVLGGDSIRSVMVASRARARGVEVTAADLHRHPSVRECAAALTAAEQPSPEPGTAPYSLVPTADRPLLPPDLEDAFPLNLLQEGMIFHRDFAAKSAVYHAIASVRLCAPFDAEVLRLVIRQLVERHPMLRTSFDMTSFSQPLQLVHRDFADPLQVQDLRGLPPDVQQGRIDEWVAAEKERGFALDQYPLIRFMAQRLDDETFQFTYGFHHEIVDGWSEALLVTELFTHYLSIVFDEPVAIRPPTSTMRDAIALELEAMGRPDNYEFWNGYLRDATLMRLPRLGRPPKADKGAREIVRVAVPVSDELSDRLKWLATDCAVPLKSVLLAAHMRVMCQYHGHSDTLTYTVTNGRPESADGSTAIGLFVNSLALRLDLTGGSWRDLIVATLDTERASMPYRRLPMAELKRHQGNEPLAETLFFFTDYHVFAVLDRWRAHGVDHLASELYGESTFPFCAIFRLNRETARLEVRIEYDSLQFPAELIDRIGECYRRVLEAMAADPDGAYHLADLLGPAERKLLLPSRRRLPALPGGGATVVELIERRAAREPDAIAVEHGAGMLSYRELVRRSGRVVARLRAHGVGPDSRVAVVAERALDTIVDILGVLRAGAAYLPIDPSHPDLRIGAVLADAAPVVVLARPGQIPPPGPIGGYPVLEIDSAAPPSEPDQSIAAPAPVPAGPAYVMYTSGSTGRPKGVVVGHAALANSTLARRPAYREPPDRFLLLSSFAVDSSVAGTFWTLVEGGTLVLPPDGIQQEPGELARYVGRVRPTHTLGVPSLLAPLVEQAKPGELASLRLLISAGEACPTELLELTKRAAPGCRLANEYGPTEGTVWSTLWQSGTEVGRTQLPIGRPIANVGAYLLNQHLNPVPLGVPGELYLGGAGVATGYLGAPGSTAAAFLPDPFAGVPGARMYRTGDLASHGPGGELDFLGRADSQVKIRGFRVELGEIEGVLDTHPAVAHSVVLVGDDPGGDRLLVGYVVAVDRGALDPAGLRAYLAERLPKHMVPAAVVVLDALPLTPVGKLDRTALPAPDRAQRVAAPPVPPRTEIEQLLAGIWAQVLGLAEVGVYDEFFDLGGESLRAMQAVTRANKVFGVELSVRTLFEASTVAGYAERIVAARHVAAGMAEPAQPLATLHAEGQPAG